MVATGVGYLGGYTAPIAAIGMLVVLLNVMPQMLFGGLFMNLNSVPPGIPALGVSVLVILDIVLQCSAHLGNFAPEWPTRPQS